MFMGIKLTLIITLFIASMLVKAETYTYDQSGRVIGITYADGKEIGYQYDASGNIASVETVAQVDTTQPTTPTEPEAPATPDTPTNPTSSDSGGGGCFIATAAYGSYFESEVEVLRNFRDQRLLTTTIGSSFVDWYYRASPPIAEYISTHEWLKPVVRSILTPVVFFIKNPLWFYTIAVFIFVLGFRKRLRRLSI